jgi:hypothetical protein
VGVRSALPPAALTISAGDERENGKLRDGSHSQAPDMSDIHQMIRAEYPIADRM